MVMKWTCDLRRYRIRLWRLSIFMTIGEHGPALIGGRKMVPIWDLKEEDEPNAEADLTAEGSLSYREERCLT